MEQPTVYTPHLVPDVTKLDLGALLWRTSSKSSGQGGACVDVAPVNGGGVVLRHSRSPEGPILAFSEAEWSAFVDCAAEFRFPPA